MDTKLSPTVLRQLRFWWFWTLRKHLQGVRELWNFQESCHKQFLHCWHFLAHSQHAFYCCTAFQTHFQDRRDPSVNASINILMFCSTLQLGTCYFCFDSITIHKTWAPSVATVAMLLAIVWKLAHDNELVRHSISILFLTDRWNQLESPAGLICIRGLA